MNDYTILRQDILARRLRVVEPVTVRPELLLPTSVPVLSQDPENAVNQRVATFYGKESVRITGENS